MINIASSALTYRLANAEAKAATVVDKFTLPTGDPGFVVTGLRVTVWGGAFGGSGSNLVSVVLKKGTVALATVALAPDQGDATAVIANIVGTGTTIPTFGPGDLFDLEVTLTGTAVKSAGGINIHVLKA
jgi:hypothetical protein